MREKKKDKKSAPLYARGKLEVSVLGWHARAHGPFALICGGRSNDVIIRYNSLEFMHGKDTTVQGRIAALGESADDAEVCDATAIQPYKLRRLEHKGCV